MNDWWRVHHSQSKVIYQIFLSVKFYGVYLLKKNNTWLPVHISLKRALSWTLQEKLHICAHPHIILYILLLRKARGSSCSCVHLQCMLTETLVPSALCYSVQLYNYIYLQLRYFYLWVYLSPLTPCAWWASLLKTPIPPQLTPANQCLMVCSQIFAITI